jgi:hypothetical protein
VKKLTVGAVGIWASVNARHLVNNNNRQTPDIHHVDIVRHASSCRCGGGRAPGHCSGVCFTGARQANERADVCIRRPSTAAWVLPTRRMGWEARADAHPEHRRTCQPLCRVPEVLLPAGEADGGFCCSSSPPHMRTHHIKSLPLACMDH